MNICNDYLIPLFPFSPLFVLVSDEQSNMFVVAIEENSATMVALLTVQFQDEMSIYYFLSLCPSKKSQTNLLLSYALFFPPVVNFQDLMFNASNLVPVCFVFSGNRWN